MSATIEVPVDEVLEVEVHHGEPTDIPIQLLVSAVGGRLRVLPPERFWRGHEVVEVGQAVAVIEPGDGTGHVVRSPVQGRLGAVLGRDGELVRPGQAVAWVERE
jgi:multidrug efflux pump subunit AcrA (membrane-fusion protein)